jgi:hypothetical protein
MARPRVADDFAAIRARIEELRRERVPAPAEPEQRQLPLRPDHAAADASRKTGRHRLPRAIRQKFFHYAWGARQDSAAATYENREDTNE